jgi:hypothetical protein
LLVDNLQCPKECESSSNVDEVITPKENESHFLSTHSLITTPPLQSRNQDQEFQTLLSSPVHGISTVATTPKTLYVSPFQSPIHSRSSGSPSAGKPPLDFSPSGSPSGSAYCSLDPHKSPPSHTVFKISTEGIPEMKGLQITPTFRRKANAKKRAKHIKQELEKMKDNNVFLSTSSTDERIISSAEFLALSETLKKKLIPALQAENAKSRKSNKDEEYVYIDGIKKKKKKRKKLKNSKTSEIEKTPIIFRSVFSHPQNLLHTLKNDYFESIPDNYKKKSENKIDVVPETNNVVNVEVGISDLKSPKIRFENTSFNSRNDLKKSGNNDSEFKCGHNYVHDCYDPVKKEYSFLVFLIEYILLIYR